MTIFAGRPVVRRQFIHEQPASLGLVFDTARAAERIMGPYNKYKRAQELSAAYENESSALIPKDAAIERAQEAGGFSFDIPDDGIRESALDILINRAVERKKAELILSRRPRGFWNTTAFLGASLIGSMQDPGNIAASFVPVVSPIRYGQMLAKSAGAFGRAATRARVGAIEGAAGAALVEPVVFYGARQEQADYDIVNSLANIAFGTVLGGGLHVGGGALLDTVTRGLPSIMARPRLQDRLSRALDAAEIEDKKAALRTGVAQVESGRKVDVEAITQPIIETAESPLTEPKPTPVTPSPAVQAPPPMATAAASGASQVGKFQVGDVVSGSKETPFKNTATVVRFSGDKAQVRFKGPDGNDIDELVDTSQIRATGRRAVMVEGKDNPFITSIQARATRDHLEKFERGEKLPGGVKEDLVDGGFLTVAGVVTPQGRSILQAQLPKIRSEQNLEQTAEKIKESMRPENADMVDPKITERSEQQFSEISKRADEDTSLDEALEELENTARTTDSEEIMQREMEPFEELDNAADEYSKATNALANCKIRRGES